jgi:predicted ArsR family transcriptional regulator
VDRLSLFKVLADSSRYSIYQVVAAAPEPLSTAEIAERLDLHPNTVRLHLEKMRDAGLLDAFSDRHGAVGRPQHRWSVGSHAPSLGVEPSGFRILAHLLAEVAAEPSSDAGRAASVGRRRGLERTGGRRHGPNQVVQGSAAACVRAVMAELADLGFDPALDDPAFDDGATVEDPEVRVGLAFTSCPFRELAVLYPDLVCELHRGLTEGVLAGIASGQPGLEARVETFASLVDSDPCRADLCITGRSAVA